MTPEGHKPSETHKIFTTTAIIGGILLLSQFAFSKSSARKIGQRAGWKSEISGKSFWDGWSLQMAHFNHDKSNPNYDKPESGICVTVEEHLKMHEDAVGNEESIGLCVQANNYAIRMLKKTPIFNKYRHK
jgi:hypothetical protein